MRLAWVAFVAVVGCRGAWAADPPVPLKPGAGDSATMAACSACHTTNYIVMNSLFLTPEAWKVEVAKMRSAFGAPIDDATAAMIAGYLGANYAAAGRP
jgi:hypothetical protein